MTLQRAIPEAMMLDRGSFKGYVLSTARFSSYYEWSSQEFGSHKQARYIMAPIHYASVQSYQLSLDLCEQLTYYESTDHL